MDDIIRNTLCGCDNGLCSGCLINAKDPSRRKIHALVEIKTAIRNNKVPVGIACDTEEVVRWAGPCREEGLSSRRWIHTDNAIDSIGNNEHAIALYHYTDGLRQ